MQKVKILMLDLKSYYPSPAYQLGLLAAYARIEDEVKSNVQFTFTGHPREQPADEIAKMILSAEVDLAAASNYAMDFRRCR